MPTIETLKIRHEGNPYYFLVSGLGDFLIDAKLKRILQPPVQAILGTNKSVMSHTRINPPEFDPAIQLGLIPGIISPFADLNRHHGIQLNGFVYYRGGMDMGIPGYRAVAISVTHTLIVDNSVFLGALNLWQGFYLNIPFRAVGKEQETPHLS